MGLSRDAGADGWVSSTAPPRPPRKEAADWRGHAALAIAEQHRRQILAKKHPRGSVHFKWLWHNFCGGGLGLGSWTATRGS